MKSILRDLLFLGTDKLVKNLVYSVSVTNMLALFGTLLSAFYLAFQIELFGDKKLYFIVYQCIVLISYFSTLAWNYFDRQEAAKIWICCVFLLDIGISSTLIYGSGSSIEWLLLLVFPISYLIWNQSETLQRGLAFAAAISLYYLISNWGGDSLITLSQEQINSMAFSSFLSTCILLALASYSFVSETSRAQRKLETMANYDALTGVLNRREFEEQVELALAQVPPLTSNALFLIDLDDFKKINDEYGHAAGDKALKHLVKLLSETLPQNAVICRLGGDEFCVFIHRTEQDEVERIARGLVDAAREYPFRLVNHSITLSVSVGVVFESKRRNVQRLIISADDAMYEAKRRGKNNYHIASLSGKI